MKLSIILCVYNEINTISEIINKILKTELINKISKEIIIIDNNSTDGTKEFLQTIVSNEIINVVFQKKNLGKGNSIIEGIKHANGDITIFQDADLEYDPKDYNKLLNCLIKNKLDAVYGSRILKNKDFHHYNINKFAVLSLTKIINYLYKTDFTDSATNYKLIKTDILKQFPLEAKSFAIDFEISLFLGIYKAKIGEVGINYYPRTYKEGKKINYLDAIKAIWVIFYKFLLYKLKKI